MATPGANDEDHDGGGNDDWCSRFVWDTYSRFSGFLLKLASSNLASASKVRG
jgi:hypothetical protein